MRSLYGPLAVACAALIGAGVANIDIKPMQTKYIRVPGPTRTIEKTKVVKVNVAPKVNMPSGYITRDQCLTIMDGTSFKEVLFRYGWPAADDGEDSYAGYLTYPLTEKHEDKCVLDFWRGHLDRKEVEASVT